MPVSFVSAGLRKTEAEEKQQQKGEEDANDSEDDAPPAPSPPRSTAPKKLQMVNFVMYESSTLCSVLCNTTLHGQLY